MVLRLIALGAFALSMVLAVTVQAANRVALVIGNSAYIEQRPLRNPQNDANAMADVLQSLGFEVVKGLDLNRREFVGKLREFTQLSQEADVALFYYAGHALQFNGSNFMVPVDGNIQSESDLQFEAINLDIVLKMMEQEDRINLVFLDACRDNPMARSLKRSLGTRSSSVGTGLAPPNDSGSGTLIGFATQPGNVALDGDNTFNSPFTAALLEHITTPNLDVALLMRRVRRDVKNATNGQQIPWTNESLTEDFSFRKVAVTHSSELALWDSIKDSDNTILFEDYLRQFPKGTFVAVARSRITSLGSVEVAALPNPKKPVVATPKKVVRIPKKTSYTPKNSLEECDLAVASPGNNDNPGYAPGVHWEDINLSDAIAKCKKAVADKPSSFRAAFQLSRAYYRSGDYEHALKYVQSPANAGYAPAQSLLGIMYATGRGVSKNEKKATSLKTSSADQGNASGQYALALSLLVYEASASEKIRGVELIRKSSSQGLRSAQHYMGGLHVFGLYNVNQDLNKAFSLYLKAANQGAYLSKYRIAQAYERAAGSVFEKFTGVPKNPQLAAGAYFAALKGGYEVYDRAWSGATGWDRKTLTILQQMLKSAGHYNGPVSGKGSTAFDSAMKRFCNCGTTLVIRSDAN